MNFKELLHLEKPMDEYDALQRERDLYKIGAFASGILGGGTMYLGYETDKWAPPLYLGGAVLTFGIVFAVSAWDVRREQNKLIRESIEDLIGPSGESQPY